MEQMELYFLIQNIVTFIGLGFLGIYLLILLYLGILNIIDNIKNKEK